MKQQSFEETHKDEWQSFGRQLDQLSHGNKLQKQRQENSAVETDNFSDAYRRICYHLALAKERQYSPLLIEQLNDMALRGHQILYKTKSAGFGYRLLQFIVDTFPTTVRQNAGLILLGFLLFYGPALAFGLVVYFDSQLIFSFFAPEQVAQFVTMYNPDINQTMAERRGATDDWVMFGFYIRNNIGIGFQTFASGLLFGLGTLFFLIYNGLALGGVAGYLTQLGYTTPFYSFVITHGAFELTAIAIAGAAGMKLGFSLIAPGRHARKQALVLAAKEAILLVYGVILMLLAAAFLEAFWSSSSTLSATTKLIVGGILWGLVIGYLLLGGRRGS